jgi:hypothetical protein
MTSLSPSASPRTNRMASLNPKELDPVYQAVDHEEAVAIANLGAQVYVAMKDRLYETWSITQSAEETQKADVWRREGGQAMMESLKARLAAGDAAAARAAALQASVDSEIERRVGEVLETYRKDYELSKMEEVHALEKQIAETKGKEHYIKMVEEGHLAMKEKIAALEAQVAEQMIANTKSSHAIGKAGEASVLELLENTVCKVFTHSSVKNMTGISHVADFHLFVMNSLGEKIKILIDSKKYKRSVNSDEIHKLYSDMDGDEECKCGIMISLSSGICTKNQFGISRTPKQKPVLFLTFQDLSEEFQKDILCWGVQSLMEIVGENKTEIQQAMIDNLDQFMETIVSSMKEFDTIIKTQQKSTESLKLIRNKIIKDLTLFRGGKPIDEDQQEEKPKIVLDNEVRCTAMKGDGNRCSNKRATDSECCKIHKK